MVFILKIITISIITLIVITILIANYKPIIIDNLQKWYETKYKPSMKGQLPNWVSTTIWLVWLVLVLLVSLFPNYWD